LIVATSGASELGLATSLERGGLDEITEKGNRTIGEAAGHTATFSDV